MNRDGVGGRTMSVERITPEETRRGLEEGRILLVCAYDDEDRFRHIRLEEAISFREFQERLPSLDKDQEIVFY